MTSRMSNLLIVNGILFADDTIVYLTVTAVDDCEKLQEDLKRLEKWEEEWQMEFHPAKVLRITRKKSRVMFRYTLHDHILEEVPSAKYLGITISNDTVRPGLKGPPSSRPFRVIIIGLRKISRNFSNFHFLTSQQFLETV